MTADFAYDVRHGFRRLLKKRLFSAAVVLTLGISIGVNVAVFSLANRLLVSGLPYADSARLALAGGLPLVTFIRSPASFNDWKSDSYLLDDGALYAVGETTLLADPEPIALHVAHVTSNLFKILGTVPTVGRTFSPEEEDPKSAKVAMVSERLWRNQFGADKSISGKTLKLNNEDHTIIGVVPAIYGFPVGADVWTPTGHNLRAWARSHAVGSTVLVRMKPMATVAQVDAQQRGWLQNHQLLDQQTDHADAEALVQPLESQFIGELKWPVLLLIGAVALVLLIGCANVSNLIIVDSIMRDHEFAVRRAVGMTTGRFFRQLVAEQFLISMLGGFTGLVLAYCSLPYLKEYLPEKWPEFALVSIDARGFVFTLAVSMLVGGVVGLLPGCAVAKRLDTVALQIGGRGSEPPSRKRWREALVCAETGLAMVLLVLAALFIQTLRDLIAVDCGFRPGNVLVASVARRNANDRELAGSQAFYVEVLARLRSLEGVLAVGGVDYLPARDEIAILKDVRQIPAETDPSSLQVSARSVAPGYFEAMGIPLVAGREFSELDDRSHQQVVIVDQKLTDKLWSGLNPIGRRISLDFDVTAVVVGIVGAVRAQGPQSEPLLEMYRPLTQSSPPAVFNFVVRTSVTPTALASQVRSLIRSNDPNQPVEIATMESYLARKLKRPRGIAGLLGVLSGLGLLLAVVGISGLVSYSVTTRTREFGIRLALGESPMRLFLRAVSSGLRPVLPGVVLGCLLASAAAKLVQSELFGVKSTPAITLSVTAISLLCASALAGIFGGRRAASLDPMTALHEE